MSEREAPTPLLERGRAMIAARERQRVENVAENIDRGRKDLRRSFVFSFYHNTMVDTHLSGAYHKLGPDSPDPEFIPSREPGELGGGWRDPDWTCTWDGIDWRAEYRWARGWGHYDLHWYVRGRRRHPFARRPWIEVQTPAGVVAALR